MTNGDPEGQIFLSHPYTKNRVFFLLTFKYRILSFKKMRHSKMKSFYYNNGVTCLPACGSSINGRGPIALKNEKKVAGM